MQVCVSIVSLTIRCHSVHQSLRAESVTRNITPVSVTPSLQLLNHRHRHRPPTDLPPKLLRIRQFPILRQLLRIKQFAILRDNSLESDSSPYSDNPSESEFLRTQQLLQLTQLQLTAKILLLPPHHLTPFLKVCLLKTAIANVSAGETTVEGHILFDEGARQPATQELANQLQLQPIHHENISVSSFGEQVSTPRRLPVATVLIQTLNKGHIPISVLRYQNSLLLSATVSVPTWISSLIFKNCH